MSAVRWSWVAILLSGCAAASQRDALPHGPRPATQAVVARAATTQPSVSSHDFDALWKACERSLQARHFRIDRRDYRAGLITTYPLISKQFFEFWRTDTLGAGDVAESSLNTIRRTVRFEIERDDANGLYTATPHVEIERYSNAGRRLTSAATYRSAFRRTDARGTRESDQGVFIPARYWYSLGNDEKLEAALASSTRGRIR